MAVTAKLSSARGSRNRREPVRRLKINCFGGSSRGMKATIIAQRRIWREASGEYRVVQSQVIFGDERPASFAMRLGPAKSTRHATPDASRCFDGPGQLRRCNARKVGNRQAGGSS